MTVSPSYDLFANRSEASPPVEALWQCGREICPMNCAFTSDRVSKQIMAILTPQRRTDGWAAIKCAHLHFGQPFAAPSKKFSRSRDS